MTNNPPTTPLPPSVYNGYLLRDLLRVIRNKASHYKEMPETLKATIGSLPEGFLSYFTKRFPSLLMHCYYMAVEVRWYKWILL